MKKIKSKLRKATEALMFCTFIYVFVSIIFFFYLKSNIFGIYTGDTTWLMFSIGAVTGAFFLICIGFIIVLKREMKEEKKVNGET
jgi:hypothetical protein